MTDPITETEINRAVAMLNKSDRGRQTMRAALAMLDDGAISLDQSGQVALITLLTAAFTSHPGTACDAMRNELIPRSRTPLPLGKLLSCQDSDARWGSKMLHFAGAVRTYVNIDDQDGRWEPVFDAFLKWIGYRLVSRPVEDLP